MTFSAFQNVLPDPNNTIGTAGQTAGSVGPGFASVKFTSEEPLLRDRTNSGRVLARSIVAHKWRINISYNPMTRDEFEPIYSFLIHRRGAMNPFFVSLPQYRTPRNSTFASYAASNNLEATGTVAAGATQALIAKTGYSNSTNNTPLPGDLFTISGTNSNHLKAYMVTRVEKTGSGNYLSTSAQPSTNQVRIHFTPGLSKEIGTGDDFIFHNPLIKVITAGDIQEYSLGTDGLFQYSLNLEEVQ